VRRWALGLLLSTAFFTSLIAPATAAHADATILSSTIDNGYPKQLTFNVTAQSAVDITDITLNYAITGTGTGALGKPSDPITAGKMVSVSVVVQVNSGSSYIPVGSNFTYHWQITTSDGNVTNGPAATFLFLPPNQTWQNVSGDFMTVYYHSNNQSLANNYLQAGVETYNKIGKQLLNTTLKITPVKVVLFDNEQEMLLALPPNGPTFNGSVTTCGTKVTQDIVLVIPLSCGSTDPTDTLRHEFGHILNQTAGGGAFGKLPSWLDEGTAVYAQTTPGDNYISAFQAAARANRLLPVSTMGSAPTDPNLVNLFYGQSYSMVKYLIDNGGPAKYAQFFATIQQGNRFDQAMSMVYGFDLPTFEKQFDASVGSQAPSAPTAAPTARPKAQSTAAPAPTHATSLTSSSSGGSDRTSIVIVGGAALLFLIGAFALLAATMIANNRRRSSRAAAAPIEPPNLPPPAPGA
jgi:hypothetical protein